VGVYYRYFVVGGIAGWWNGQRLTVWNVVFELWRKC